MSHSFLTTGEQFLEGDLGERGKIWNGSSAKWLKGKAERAVMSNEAAPWIPAAVCGTRFKEMQIMCSNT